MISTEEFQEKRQSAIHDNTITLPTLPEVALRAREVMEQENSTAVEVAEVVATDAALAARLLQVANSALYRGRVPIDSIQMAITRLGNALVRNLIISIAMKQIFQATSDSLDKQLRATWEEGVQIAAISRVLAQPLSHIDNDQAMLSGLIHNIGNLPVLMMADRYPELLEDAEHLSKMVTALGPTMGHQILEEWGFPESMVKVPANYQNLDYDGGSKADYVDIVLVALLQTLPPEHPSTWVDWRKIPSFAKIGLEPNVEVVNMDGAAEQLQEVENMFLS
jgi:HD-like signal output (HDOD) protein